MQRPNKRAVETLQDALRISPIAAKILVARGVETAEQAQQLLRMTDEALHDPFKLYGMQQAVERIERALQHGEKICVYGDYDADGITSTTVMMMTLLELGADVICKIPNRFEHGYGPNEALFRRAYEEGVQLMITVDNGISGHEPIRVAKELGMDVIVTDHHEAGETLPPADIIIHPRVPIGHYPFGELAGVGVAFKLAHALYGEVPRHLVEYVAIGTVADLVSLVDENRYFVQQGIKALQRSSHPWVRALCEVSSAEQSAISEETIGFYFAPRLNAIGRLGDAMPGVELLMSEDRATATALAKNLNRANAERKDIVKAITDEAVAMISTDEQLSQSLVLVVAGEGWNPGVVGIVASRLVEQYYKPTIVLSIDREKGIAKGSARSIEGFHLYNELAKNRDILPHFGGHPMAAGMTMPLEHVDTLRKRLHEQAQACLTDEQLTPKLVIDIPVELHEITVEAIEEMAQLGPFGMAFPKPVFALENVEIASMRKIGAAENHVKMVVQDDYGTVDAIGFDKGHLHDELTYGVKVSFVGDLQINEWQGKKKPQFMIHDVQTTEWQLFDIRGIRQTARWLMTVPIEQVIFFAFRTETVHYYESLIQAPIQFVNDAVDGIGATDYIVLLDLPYEIATLETLLERTMPKRIYAHFYMSDSQYFNGMPTREQFSWYYTFLKQRPNFPIMMHLSELAKYKGWHEEWLKLMTRVFYELGFVTINKGLLTTVDNPPKKELAEAPAYQRRQQQLEMEQKLLYAPYVELKQWLNDILQRID